MFFGPDQKKHSGQMAINSEIQPRRPRNDRLLEILSKSALALALEGLQTAPRLSVLFGPIVFFLVRTKRNTRPKWQLILEAGSARQSRPGAECFNWTDSVFWTGPKRTDSYGFAFACKNNSGCIYSHTIYETPYNN